MMSNNTIITTTDNQDNEDDQLKAKKIDTECSRMFDSIKQLYGEFVKKFLHEFCNANKKSSWYEEQNVEMDNEFAYQLLNWNINRSRYEDNIDKLKNLFAWSNTRRMKGQQSGKTMNEKQFKNFIDNNKMEETYVLLLIFFVSNGYNICKQHKLFSNSTNDDQISGSNSNSNSNSKEEEKEIKVKFFGDLLKWTLEQKTKEGGARLIFQEAKGMKKIPIYDKLKKMFLNGDTHINIEDFEDFIKTYFENEGGLAKLIEFYKSKTKESHDRLKITYSAHLALYNSKHIHSNRNINNIINNTNNMSNKNHYSSNNGSNTINNIGSNGSNDSNGYVNDMTTISGSDIGNNMNSMNSMNSMNGTNTKTRSVGKTTYQQFTGVSGGHCPHPKRRKKSICSGRRYNNNNNVNSNNNNNNNVNGLRKFHRVFNKINVKKMWHGDRDDEKCKGKIYFVEDGSVAIEVYCSIHEFFDFGDFSGSLTGFTTPKQLVQNEKQNDKKIQTRLENVTELANLSLLTDDSFKRQVDSRVQSQVQPQNVHVSTLPKTGMASAGPLATETRTGQTRVTTWRATGGRILHSSDSNGVMTSMNDNTTTSLSGNNTISSHPINSAEFVGGKFKMENMNGNVSSINNLNNLNNLNNMNNINSSNNIGLVEDGSIICGVLNPSGGNKSSFGNAINDGLNGDFSSRSQLALTSSNTANNRDLMSLSQVQIPRNGSICQNVNGNRNRHTKTDRNTTNKKGVFIHSVSPHERIMMNGMVNPVNERMNMSQFQALPPPPPPMNSNVDYRFGANKMKNLNVENINNLSNIHNINDQIHSSSLNNNGNINSSIDPSLIHNSAIVGSSSTMASLSGDGAGNMISDLGMNGHSNIDIYGNVNGRCNLNGNINGNGNDSNRSYWNSASGVNSMNPIDESGVYCNNNGNSNVNSNVNKSSNANVDYLFGANEMKNSNVDSFNNVKNVKNVNNVNHDIHSLNNGNVNSLNDPSLTHNSAMVHFPGTGTMANLGGSGTGSINMIYNSNANSNANGNVNGRFNLNGNENGNVHDGNNQNYLNLGSFGVNNTNMFNRSVSHWNNNGNSNVNLDLSGNANTGSVNSCLLNINHNGRNNNGMNNNVGIHRQNNIVNRNSYNNSNKTTNGFGFL